MARNTAASGVPKMADIPAVAPAARIILRSTGLTVNNCPSVEPNAPPVAIIGPSAPNGPPVPIAIAEDTGFNMAIEGFILLWFVSTCSMASGIPCPLIAFDP
ncbi:hypothetical protein D3C85_1438750 [compost metagenome]